MDNVIYYFSATGNSLAVAKDLQSALGDTALTAIDDGSSPIEVTAKTIGVVFPVYCWGLPSAVDSFMGRLRLSGDAFVYSVATYGGSAGLAHKQAQSILSRQAIVLSAYFSVKMPGNYIPMYDVPSEPKREAMFLREKAIAPEIATKVKNRARMKKIGVSPVDAIILRNVYAKFLGKMKKVDETFTVDASCNSCGSCARVCPKGNIALVDGKPSWEHRCESCLACVHWCPQRAIQIGDSIRGRARYHHPSVSLTEMSHR